MLTHYVFLQPLYPKKFISLMLLLQIRKSEYYIKKYAINYDEFQVHIKARYRNFWYLEVIDNMLYPA